MSLKDAMSYVVFLFLPLLFLIPKIWNTAAMARDPAAIVCHELLCKIERDFGMIEWEDHSLILNKMWELAY